MAGAYRRAVEQAFVQSKVDEISDEARECGENVKIPENLLATVRGRLDEDQATTWDAAVRELAIQNIDDNENQE